jgi:quinone-modifying oxidoreductase subunit QmoC
MASATTISPVPGFRDELIRRGGGNAARCFQCATCSGVCELATPEMAFPRPQMLHAQWGLADRLAADPAIWLCHQCNDCTARCPRDAKPGDAIQAIRSLMIEEVGAPKFMARLVGRAGATWPILLGLPVLFWAALIGATRGFEAPTLPLVYADFVPTIMLQSVFVPAFAFAAIIAAIGARRCWVAWGQTAKRDGSLIGGLAGVVGDILGHKRFGTCVAARPRRFGHLFVLWGFILAFTATAIIAVQQDLLGMHEASRSLTHPVKLFGNAAAILLGIGVLWLLVNRLTNQGAAGRSSGYDNFFLALIVLLVFSGIGSEVARLAELPVPVALGLYVLHLGMMLSLVLTFPFSKFAHALYRTLAMAHERVTAQRR